MASSVMNPALLQQFQTTNPQLMEQYRQLQQEQQAEVPQQNAPPPVTAKPALPVAPRRPYRPSISGGRLFHSRPFSHLGKKK